MPDPLTEENGKTSRTLMTVAVALILLVALLGAFPRVREEVGAWRGFLDERVSRQLTPASALPKRSFHITLPLPPDGRPTRAVRVAVLDRRGQRNVYHRSHRSGSPVTIPVSAYGERGEVEIQVYLDGALYNRQQH